MKLLKVIAAGIVYSYIQDLFGELIYTISGQEFVLWKEKTLIIVKALYGLNSSGEIWQEKLSDNLRDMGFWPCYADFDICVRS